MLSSVALLMDWIDVSETKPMRHWTGLSGSVQFSCPRLVNYRKRLNRYLTIVAEQIHETQIGSSDAHKEDLCSVMRSVLELVALLESRIAD